MTDAAPVTVVFIAFRDYGAAPVERFFASLDTFPAGVSYRLLVALKGNCAAEEASAVDALAAARGDDVLEVPDGGWDIGTYLHVARQIGSGPMCLFNTSSAVLADDWLAKLHRQWCLQGGGAVAATGSWESRASDTWAIARDEGVSAARREARFLRMWRRYPGFPNPHLRTNGMVIAAESLLRFRPDVLETKEDAYDFESGRRGLSATLARDGLSLSVVGRDGRAFQPMEWHRSGTFWQGDQSNLLIADNQTRRYESAAPEERGALARMAWENPRRAATGGITARAAAASST